MQQTLNWQEQLPEGLSEKLQWLMQQPSLTAALRSLDTSFSVRLLHLGLSESRGWFSDRHFPAQVFSREVLLCLSGQPVVWARSVCEADDAVWHEVLDCGTQPLGERLFNGALPLVRTPFEYCSCGHVVLPYENASPIAARRSVFSLNGNRLGLVECFLDDFE
ncbi:chorismate--pyruvate lyase family protein [Neisseria wadsworthii]|uniref:chorismate--pyruvate lyase family protein n=1 Tax=Neisseria wadsworthii TaxID=607711 RepID=UPI000D30181D|nr:chorismate lyase [Neisseria wadsworthii]